MKHAVCAEAGAPEPDTWHPEDRDTPGTQATAEAWAKKVCGGCPVVADCAGYAIGVRITHGVWGGLNPKERREAAAQHGLKPLVRHGTVVGYVHDKCKCTRCKRAWNEKAKADDLAGRSWRKRQAAETGLPVSAFSRGTTAREEALARALPARADMVPLEDLEPTAEDLAEVAGLAAELEADPDPFNSGDLTVDAEIVRTFLAQGEAA